MYKVFISHSSKDKPFVRKLKEDLNFNEIETWVDEDELRVGDDLHESLLAGINQSTHFLIVLSNQIKGSDWIELELNEALSSFDNNILKKIIPILLRQTDIPKPINNLFRADFSSISFTLKDEKVSFVGDVYQKEFNKIIAAIKGTLEYKLTDTEKSTIVAESDKISSAKRQSKIVGYYEIVGFATKESKRNTIINLKSNNSGTPLNKIATESIRPVILPSLLKPLFDHLELGDKVLFPVGGVENLEAHFCGYSLNNSRIVVPAEIRTAFGIKIREVVLLEVDGKTNSITFID